jgi:Fur family transcriptional regulator, ferric uptake regulator
MSHHGHDHEEAFEHARQILEKSSLRVTQPRLAILKVLADEHGPFTMEEIHSRLKKGACDLVTLYRTLPALEAAGVVRRCDFGDGTYRYEFAHKDHHHHHIICKKCRGVATLDICLVEGLEKLVREKGYTDVAHSLEFFGVCPKCQKG